MILKRFLIEIFIGRFKNFNSEEILIGLNGDQRAASNPKRLFLLYILMPIKNS